MQKSLQKISCILILLIGLFCIGGCGSSPKSDEKNTSSQVAQHTNVDFNKIDEMARKDFLNSETYPLVQDISFSMVDRNGRKVIALSAIVGDSISKENLLSLADSMLRSYGSWASLLYEDTFSAPSKDSYGSVFDDYDAWVIIVPASDPKHKVYISTPIPAGMQTKKTIEPENDFRG